VKKSSLTKQEQSIIQQFGEKVRILRKNKGYSQEKFADVVGMHRTYMGSIERGEQNISLVNIYKIAKTLKIKISELFN
jgi:transcriptional regulator with XRE-family HTH domain